MLSRGANLTSKCTVTKLAYVYQFIPSTRAMVLFPRSVIKAFSSTLVNGGPRSKDTRRHNGNQNSRSDIQHDKTNISSIKRVHFKDPFLLSDKINQFIKRGQLDDAINLVKSTTISSQSDVVWNKLIQECSRAKRTRLAFRVYNEMKRRGFKPTDRTYTLLLESLANNPTSPDTVEQATALYNQISDPEDTPPSIIHTNAYLKVLSRAGNPSAVLRIYDTMPKKGPLSPDNITFQIVIGSLAHKGGDEAFHSAMAVWEDLFKAARRDATLMTSNSKGERNIIHPLRKVQIDEGHVTGMLIACKNAADPKNRRKGLAIVRDMYGIDLEHTVYTDEEVQEKKGKYVSHLTTLTPKAMDVIISFAASVGTFTMALNALQNACARYTDFNPDAQNINNLLARGCFMKRERQALKLLWWALEEKNVEPNAGTLRLALHACTRDRDWKCVVRICKEMGQRGVSMDVDGALSIIKCAIDDDRKLEAISFIEQAGGVEGLLRAGKCTSSQRLQFIQNSIKMYSKAMKLGVHPTLGDLSSRHAKLLELIKKTKITEQTSQHKYNEL
ncbi:uncharacterized protein VTP21DRAFT_1022 [Calcarisporiella thermophila]|uniref:uncharacterized protein n=1 Tax=Calcarisporiella thermophila TaxID=911321 RepID=UPI003742101A